MVRKFTNLTGQVPHQVLSYRERDRKWLKSQASNNQHTKLKEEGREVIPQNPKCTGTPAE